MRFEGRIETNKRYKTLTWILIGGFDMLFEEREKLLNHRVYK